VYYYLKKGRGNNKNTCGSIVWTIKFSNKYNKINSIIIVVIMVIIIIIIVIVIIIFTSSIIHDSNLK